MAYAWRMCVVYAYGVWAWRVYGVCNDDDEEREEDDEEDQEELMMMMKRKQKQRPCGYTRGSRYKADKDKDIAHDLQ